MKEVQFDTWDYNLDTTTADADFGDVSDTKAPSKGGGVQDPLFDTLIDLDIAAISYVFREFPTYAGQTTARRSSGASTYPGELATIFFGAVSAT